MTKHTDPLIPLIISLMAQGIDTPEELAASLGVTVARVRKALAV